MYKRCVVPCRRYKHWGLHNVHWFLFRRHLKGSKRSSVNEHISNAIKDNNRWYIIYLYIYMDYLYIGYLHSYVFWRLPECLARIQDSVMVTRLTGNSDNATKQHCDPHYGGLLKCYCNVELRSSICKNVQSSYFNQFYLPLLYTSLLSTFNRPHRPFLKNMVLAYYTHAG